MLKLLLKIKNGTLPMRNGVVRVASCLVIV